MATIARLFGKSPFSALQRHMAKVSDCIDTLGEALSAFANGKYDEVDTLVKQVSKSEHEADLTKNDIRNHLPKSIFLPIDRQSLLEILSIQDDIADQAERVGHLFSLYKLELPKDFATKLVALFEKNKLVFKVSENIIHEMKDLLESSFGGAEAEKVKILCDEASFKEYEADKEMHAVNKAFFAIAESVSAPTFYLFMKIIEELNHIAHISEHLANKLRTIVEVK